jgi:hypothetical protein
MSSNRRAGIGSIVLGGLVALQAAMLGGGGWALPWFAFVAAALVIAGVAILVLAQGVTGAYTVRVHQAAGSLKVRLGFLLAAGACGVIGGVLVLLKGTEWAFMLTTLTAATMLVAWVIITKQGTSARSSPQNA